MPFTSAVRQAFSRQKAQPSTLSVYTQSPAEQYHRSPQTMPSQTRPLRPQRLSLPRYRNDAGIYSQSPNEVYMRRDSHRQSQPAELPRYQPAATNSATQSYAPISDYVPEYYHRESATDERHNGGEPPQYQK